MAIWKLEPIDLNSPTWKTSAWNKEIFVRADWDWEARDVAAEGVREMTEVTEGKRWERIESQSPWHSPALTSVAIVRDSNYPAEGEHEIVGTPELLDLIRPSVP